MNGNTVPGINLNSTCLTIQNNLPDNFRVFQSVSGLSVYETNGADICKLC